MSSDIFLLMWNTLFNRPDEVNRETNTIGITIGFAPKEDE